MNIRRYRAWRFLHPDLDTPEGRVGLGFSPSGGIEVVEDRASVRRAGRHFGCFLARITEVETY